MSKCTHGSVQWEDNKIRWQSGDLVDFSAKHLKVQRVMGFWNADFARKGEGRPLQERDI